MSELNDALYGDTETVIAVMNETADPQLIAAAVMNLARRIQGLEQNQAKAREVK